MLKTSAVVFSAAFLIAIPAYSHEADRHAPANQDMSAHQHYGGHWRHMHRDWSTPDKHVHSICYEWDEILGWQWMCR